MTDKIQQTLTLVTERSAQLLAETIALTEIPAPPFGEAARSAYIARRFRDVGLQEVSADGIGNVTGRRPGPVGSPRVMVVSHMDTVFPSGTDVTVRVEGERAYAPGIRDNSSAVASLISLVSILEDAGLELPCDLILAASVGEEGLGDLRGVRQLIADWETKLDYVIAYDGEFGGLTHGGVASRRLKVTYLAPGGHSFGDFGSASAIHGLAAACHRFASLPVPDHPKTTLNVGTFQGGTAVNVIAEQAEALIDMRSVGMEELQGTIDRAIPIFEMTAAEMGCEARIQTVGERPGGLIPQDHPLVALAAQVIREMGREPRFSISSTDANIPLSRGIPAICIGAGNGRGAHTLGEYLEIASLVPGLQQLIRVLARMDELRPQG